MIINSVEIIRRTMLKSPLPPCRRFLEDRGLLWERVGVREKLYSRVFSTALTPTLSRNHLQRIKLFRKAGEGFSAPLHCKNSVLIFTLYTIFNKETPLSSTLSDKSNT